MLTGDPYGLSRGATKPGHGPVESSESKATWANDTPGNIKTCLNCPLPVCVAGCSSQHTGPLDPARRGTKKSVIVAECREIARMDFEGRTSTEIRRALTLTHNKLAWRRKQAEYRAELERLRKEAGRRNSGNQKLYDHD